MELLARERIICILKRFFRQDPDLLQDKSENDLVDASVMFVTQVMLGRRRRKRMRPYLMKLLDIPAVAEQLSKWTCKIGEGTIFQLGSNILHLACEAYDKQFILNVIEKCGKELMSTSNYGKVLPVHMLQFNHHYNDTFELLKYFYEQNVDLALFKTKIIDVYDIYRTKLRDPTILSKKSMREIIRFLFEYQLVTADDAKRIEMSFSVASNLSYWGLAKKEGKFPTLNGELIYFYHMALKSQPICRDNNLYKYLHQHKIMRYLTSSHDDLVTTLIHTRFTDDDALEIVDKAFTKLLWYEEDCKAKNSKIIEALLHLPHMRNNAKVLDWLTVADPRLTFLIADVKFHKLNLPNEYLQPLEPHLETWMYGPVYSKSDPIDVIFEIEKLPSDLLAIILGFVPYKTIKCFSITCKKFREFVDKNLLVWQFLTQKYFPLDNAPLQATSNENSFLARYTSKFEPQPISSLWLFNRRGFSSLEVHKNTLVWSSTNEFGIFDLESNSAASATVDSKYCSVRTWNDIVFVRSEQKLDLYSKTGLHKIGSCEDFPPTSMHFAVNDQYLFSKDVAYDWKQGKVVSNFRSCKLQNCLIRDNICYGLSSSNLCVIDPRTKSAVVTERDLDFAASAYEAVLNVYDYQIYLGHEFVELLDIRWMNQSRKSSMALSRNKVIDLVAMNVWSQKVVWDLTDLTWTRVPATPELDTRLAVCNGKHVIYSEGYELRSRPLSGNHYFPYSDFRA